ncbi:hypothetical protein OKIT_1283 [Oenococcus kitaharae DSM 17330]|uniref:Uncharacterized protein n=1 Tax=Oenococcus kitaharae DSM 17330 TaxID=1045004 RepID=G9WGV8_9LACO|nr:hypothetical protein OKIT_1283 [Oenococcus kitaharae DSM 17330]
MAIMTITPRRPAQKDFAPKKSQRKIAINSAAKIRYLVMFSLLALIIPYFGEG